MKKLLIQIVSLILILAMLTPMLLACKDDDDDVPPPDDDDDDTTAEEENKVQFIEASLKNTEITAIADFSSQALKDKNPRLRDASKFVVKDGKPTLEYTASKTDACNILLPEAIDVADAQSIAVSIYSESSTDASITLKLPACEGTVEMKLNFIGWKTFEFLVDSVSVKNPFPKITDVTIIQTTGDSSPTVWIGNIEAQKKVYDILTPDGVDLNDSKIYDAIVDNYRTFLIGTEDMIDTAAYQEKIRTANEACTANWQLFKDTYATALASGNGLFGIDMKLGIYGEDTTYVAWDEEKTYKIYSAITPMARAYATKGTDYYKNADLLADIKLALDWCWNNFYGQCVVDKGTVGNWWPWDIGCPMQLIPILVYICDDLTLDEIKHYLVAYDYLVPFPMGTGANLVDMAVNVIAAGALEQDAYKIAQAQYMVQSLFEYTTMDDMGAGKDGGFFTDGSFIQHSVTPYAGAYGLTILEAMPKMIYIAKDTPFAFHGESLNNTFAWMFDTYQAIMYDGNLMGGHIGRSIIQSEKELFDRIVTGMITMLAYVPDDIKPQFESLVKTMMLQAETDFEATLSPAFATLAKGILENSDISVIDDYYVTKVFGNMCRVSHHGPKYGVSLSLSSKLITKYESINGANFTGWYQGDGMIYIYTDGYEYDADYFSYANPYRMPGTTVNSAIRMRGNIHPTIPNKYSYAGGAQQGKYGTAGYKLGYGDTSTLQNTYLNASEATIEARKSYFFFDDEIVCLGSGISDTSNTDVLTIVENREWREGDKLYIDGTERTGSALHIYNLLTPHSGKSSSDWGLFNHPASEVLTSNYLTSAVGVRSMYFTNMGGYVFLNTGGGTVEYGKVTVNGNASTGTISNYSATGSMDFLEITINHGKNTNGGKYAYVYLPEATKEETDAYAATGGADIVIVKNDEKVHAVYEKTLGILMINTFADLVTLNVGASGAPITKLETADCQGSFIIKKNEQGQTVISVCDPTQTSSTLIFTVYGSFTSLATPNNKVTAQFDDGCVTLTVNVAGMCGGTTDIVLA